MDERTRGLASGALLGVILLAAIFASRSGAIGPVAAGSPAPNDGAFGSPDPWRSLPPPVGVEGIYALFGEPGPATMDTATVRTVVTKAGDVVLPSGRIVVDDVWFLDGGEPLALIVPPGSHPVTLLLADDGAGEAVAAAMVRLAPGDPVRWTPAVLDGVDASRLDPDTFTTYGVDSGTAAFAAVEAVDRLRRDESLSGPYGDELTRQMFPSASVIRNSAVLVIDPPTGANVVAFASGFGDGGYAAWFGLGKTGEPLVLVTSFDILDAR